MSGGRYQYAYCRVEQFASEMAYRGDSASIDRKVFRQLLEKVAEAMRVIEWVDSGDGGDEVAAIRDCFSESHYRLEMIKAATADAKEIHEKLGKLLEAAQ